MKHVVLVFFVMATIGLAASANAQQSSSFDGYTVHYNALSTSQLTPQVAQAYNIQRSSNRALLNITVLDGEEQPVTATVTANARNLTGQRREIRMREVTEGDDAIYYIGEFRVNHMEMFDFTVDVIPQGAAEPLEVRFRQQFYTE